MVIASRPHAAFVAAVLSLAARSSSSCENISVTLSDWAKARTVASTPSADSGFPTLHLCFPDLILFRMMIIRSVGEWGDLRLCLLLSSIAEETAVSRPYAGDSQTSTVLSSDGDA